MATAEQQTILFSDIRGYSAFTAERGDEEAYRLSTTFFALAAEHSAAHKGRVVKTYGDGVMSVFAEPCDGVRGAVAVQKNLEMRIRENPEIPVSVGVGIATGSVIITPGDAFGRTVNLAKRLSDQAKGGQIVISSEVKDNVSEGGYQYRDLGMRELKGLGIFPLYEVIWREEVARLGTRDDALELVLTQDNRLVIEVNKEIQRKLAEVRNRLRAEGEKRGGLAAAIIKGVEDSLSRTFQSLGSSLAMTPLDHLLKEVDVAVEGNELVLKPKSGREIRLGARDVDIQRAKEFASQVMRRKSGSDTSGFPLPRS